MTLAAHAFYTACDRVRPVVSYVTASTIDTGDRLIATRLAAILKGSGVGENQDDTYVARREELDAQFRALPQTGGIAYWHRIEDAETGSALPLEVLARCFRERATAGASRDAERILELIWLRVQPRVQQWARKVALSARSGMRPQLQDDLEQQCFIKLWKELANDGRLFLLERFVFTLRRIFQHGAREIMEQAGEWQRPGVEIPTRIPRAETDSIEAKPKGENDVPLSEQIPDMSTQDAFERAELSDVLALVEGLPEGQRALIFDQYWRDLPQKDIADARGVTTRTIRNWLKAILRELGEHYQGGEEGNHA